MERGYGERLKTYFGNKMQIVMKIMFGVMAILILLALSLTIEEFSVDLGKNASFNCADHVDYDSANTQTNTLGCAVADLITPMIVLLIIVAVVGWVLYGRLDQEMAQSYAPTGYPGY